MYNLRVDWFAWCRPRDTQDAVYISSIAFADWNANMDGGLRKGAAITNLIRSRVNQRSVVYLCCSNDVPWWQASPQRFLKMLAPISISIFNGKDKSKKKSKDSKRIETNEQTLTLTLNSSQVREKNMHFIFTYDSWPIPSAGNVATSRVSSGRRIANMDGPVPR
jgi:hypothetical protein